MHGFFHKIQNLKLKNYSKVHNKQQLYIKRDRLNTQNMCIFFPFLLCFSNNTKYKIRKIQYININIKSQITQ